MGETVAFIKAKRAKVAGKDPEQEPACSHLPGFLDGDVHHLLTDAGALELREEIDALQLYIRWAEVRNREVRCGKHGITDRRVAISHDSEPGSDTVFGEVFCIDAVDVMTSAVLHDGRTGKHAGERFEEGSGGDEGESFSILKQARPDCDLINTIHRRSDSPEAH